MRNLLEYPLEAQEVLAALDVAISRNSGAVQGIGDTTGIGLHALREMLMRRPELLAEAAAVENDRLAGRLPT